MSKLMITPKTVVGALLSMGLVAILLLLGVACASAPPAPTPQPTAVAPAKATPAPAKESPTAPAPAKESSAAPAKAASPKVSRIDELYELAKKEGALYWNLGAPAEDNDKIIGAFKSRFPAIKVETIDVDGPTMSSRIVTEASAGKVSVDVNFASLAGHTPAFERDLIERIDWTGIEVANQKDIIADGRAVKMIDQPWVIFYNKKHVSDAEAPKTWDDLLDPKWKGKITLHRIPVNLVALSFAWGEQKATDYVKKLAKNEVVRAAGSSDVVDRVQRGEQVLGNVDILDILTMQKEGAPLGITSISPQYAMGDNAVLYKNAPHPNAGRLLMAWLATADAKKAFQAQGYSDFGSCNSSDAAKVLCDMKIELYFDNTPETAATSARLRTEFAQILGFTAR